MEFFNDVFPTLLFSGFFIAVGLIIAWSGSGLNFDIAIRQKPWRRKVILGLGFYLVGLCTFRIVDDVVTVANGYPISDINPKEVTFLVVFVALGIAVIRKVYKPKKIIV